jgi:SOS response associated peptidase (SRAP)
MIPFRRRRCLIPADGFYEWRKTAKPKLPFAMDGIGLVQRVFLERCEIFLARFDGRANAAVPRRIAIQDCEHDLGSQVKTGRELVSVPANQFMRIMGTVRRKSAQRSHPESDQRLSSNSNNGGIHGMECLQSVWEDAVQ